LSGSSALARALVALVVLATLSLSGCGGGEEEPVPPPTTPATTPAAEAAEGTVGSGQAETIEDAPFVLNTHQPVPPNFESAYNRRALITVQFYKEPDDPFYPEGLSVDEQVRSYVDELQPEYPTVEFFAYDIGDPGSFEEGARLEQGEYGTLAAQLGVGITPFIATLAPRGDQYVIENLFQGYVPRPVVGQALFDLTAVQEAGGGNASDVNVVIPRIELTETGGGIEYVTVENLSGRTVNLQGFSLRVLNPETGQVDPDAPGVTINESIQAPAKRSVSVGRDAQVRDSRGRPVAGIFEGGEDLSLAPGDQLALLDSGGAVAATITV
jgi:hypothetical protein